MILNALCEYYDLMSEVEDSGISPYGFQTTKANYAAVISEDGELKDIISLNQSNNKQPQLFNMPMSLKKPGIGASPVCDNFEYIFGITGEKGEKELSEKKFMSAKMLHIEMFKDADSIEAKAIMNYFKSWDINKAWQNESILKHYSDKGKAFSGNVVFRMTGSSCYFHQVKEIEKIWLAYNEKEAAINGATIAQCSVTGQNAPIARLHRQFNGVEGASTMGASLVCFNKDSDESYGLEQSKNSAVSEQVVFKYGTALQHMLANVKQKIMIGDATTVFWAGAADNSYIDIFSYMLNKPDEQGEDSAIEDIKTRDMVKSILQDGIAGIYNDTKIDPLAKFYILGLSPNAGRISVRFFYQNSFASFCEKIKQHYDDVAIYGGKNGRQHIKIGSLLYATISSKSKDKKINPLLGGAVARAILTGAQYPQLLLNQTIIRIKAETEITQPRAAIIKGFITRKNRLLKKKEELSMYLNETSKNPAYVLGRTFAILEMIQKNALGDINATIKDKYFASACSNPSLVFPSLLKLTQHHLAKIEGNYWNAKLGNCLGLIESERFPKTLKMEDQGMFILGYYQQNQKNYEKKQLKEEEK